MLFPPLSRVSRVALHVMISKELIGDCLDIWYSARRLNLRGTREKSGTGETRAMREERERRDGQDGWELRVALFPPVSPVSLESGIGDCRRSVHE